jgi:hypothetical protein
MKIDKEMKKKRCLLRSIDLRIQWCELVTLFSHRALDLLNGAARCDLGPRNPRIPRHGRDEETFEKSY